MTAVHWPAFTFIGDAFA